MYIYIFFFFLLLLVYNLLFTKVDLVSCGYSVLLVEFTDSLRKPFIT